MKNFTNWFNNDLQRNNRIQFWLNHGRWGIRFYFNKAEIVINILKFCLYIRFNKKEILDNINDDIFSFYLCYNHFCIRIKNKYLINEFLPTGLDHLCWKILDPITKQVCFEVLTKKIKFLDYYDEMILHELKNSISYKLTYKYRNETLVNIVRTCYKCGVWYRPIFFGCFKTVTNFVEFKFSEEFGEGRGTWKGGTISSSGQIKNFSNLYNDSEIVLKEFCNRNKNCEFISLEEIS